MDMQRSIFVCAALSACSPSFRTAGYQLQPAAAAPSAPLKVLRNGVNPAGSAKLGSIVFRGVPLSGYCLDRLGVELGFEPLSGTEAAKAGYARVGVFHEQLVRLGGVVSLFRYRWIGGVTRVDLGLGGNYARLTLHDDLKDLARQNGL